MIMYNIPPPKKKPILIISPYSKPETRDKTRSVQSGTLASQLLSVQACQSGPKMGASHAIGTLAAQRLWVLGLWGLVFVSLGSRV